MTYNIRHGLSLLHDTFFSLRSVWDLNYGLTCFMLSHINPGDRVAVHLTGGKDTRVLLSILLYNKVKLSCLTCNHNSGRLQKLDNKISYRICKDLGLHYIHYDFSSLNELIEAGNSDFDVVFGGKVMGGVLGGGFIWQSSLLHTLDEYTGVMDKSNLVTPFVDAKILLLSCRIPFYLRCAGIVHKELLKLNYPVLLRYQFTWPI